MAEASIARIPGVVFRLHLALAVDAQCREWQKLEPSDRNRLVARLAHSIVSVLDLVESYIDLLERARAEINQGANGVHVGAVRGHLLEVGEVVALIRTQRVQLIRLLLLNTAATFEQADSNALDGSRIEAVATRTTRIIVAACSSIS